MQEHQTDQLSDLNLQADSDLRQSLGASVKWSKFIAITVFIFCIIFIILGIMASSVFEQLIHKLPSDKARFFKDFPAGIFAAVIFVICGAIGFVYYFLYNFSAKIKTALLTEDQESFNTGFNSLKIFFIVSTVVSILFLLSSIISLF
ncbi:MAG: hypothetical protein JST81_12960 [Bacteroidetes bacterium]|nr:hypothetical protein [Bacteroidota bacterium]